MLKELKQSYFILKHKDYIANCFGIDNYSILICKRSKHVPNTCRGRHVASKKSIYLYTPKLKTLLHELTHAYQYKNCPSMIMDNEFYLETQDDNYFNRPIEQHARLVANRLYKIVDKYGIGILSKVNIPQIMQEEWDKVQL